MLAFSDSKMIKLATEEFIPVAGDDWYQRRREDAEGEFFKKVADHYLDFRKKYAIWGDSQFVKPTYLSSK